MIEIDVVVPSLNMTYDFLLDENTSVENIIEEVTEVICQNEHIELDERTSFDLCCPLKKQIFDHSAQLSDYGIKNGDTLMLV